MCIGTEHYLTLDLFIVLYHVIRHMVGGYGGEVDFVWESRKPVVKREEATVQCYSHGPSSRIRTSDLWLS